ncbi:ATP-binding protein [Lysobacter firmicutimachus]|uniref:ATP-binding protein n=1 Tax=Lysobacter firmicutimachus TaxID=1792846 RepID=A0AAU8MKY5_9GAMM
MAISKDQHEAFAVFFSKPTRDALRDVLKRSIGETDYLEFKGCWPEIPKVAKHILALANSGGGAMVVGVDQMSDGMLVPTGLDSLIDKADLMPRLRAFIPGGLEFQVIDFPYAASEYPELVGKMFQVLLVEDTPKLLPFLALKDGDGVRANAVYVRSGTRSAEADHRGLQSVLNRRIETGHSNQPGLDLEKHLMQLRVLDELRPDNDCWLNSILEINGDAADDLESSDYKNFLSSAYESKKELICGLLGIAKNSEGGWD